MRLCKGLHCLSINLAFRRIVNGLFKCIMACRWLRKLSLRRVGMGKKGTWFSAVKKAFRSPSKDKDSTKNVAKDPDPVGELPSFEVPVSSPLSPPPPSFSIVKEWQRRINLSFIKCKLTQAVWVVLSVVLSLWQVKPKSRRRWSFGKSSHQQTTPESKDNSAEKKAEEYSKNGLFRTPENSVSASRKPTPVHHLTALTTYTTPEDWAAIRIQTAFRAYLVW